MSTSLWLSLLSKFKWKLAVLTVSNTSVTYDLKQLWLMRSLCAEEVLIELRFLDVFHNVLIFSKCELCCRLSVCGLSVCLSSVAFVHPTQLVEIFHNFSMPFGTLAIHWHPRKIFMEIVSGEPPLSAELNARGVAKYSDFWPIEGYILEMVQDRR